MKTENKILDLENVLEYKNNAIVNKFTEKYDVSFSEAQDLFVECLKWMWLCAFTFESNENSGTNYPKVFIDNTMIMLDEMWHTFILFTKEYQSFCEKYFGFFLHHSPTTKLEKDELRKRVILNRELVLQETYDKTKKQYELIQELLGEETLKKWYIEFADKYTVNEIDKLRITESQSN
jgi:hypothetical protein